MDILEVPTRDNVLLGINKKLEQELKRHLRSWGFDYGHWVKHPPKENTLLVSFYLGKVWPSYLVDVRVIQELATQWGIKFVRLERHKEHQGVLWYVLDKSYEVRLS